MSDNPTTPEPHRSDPTDPRPQTIEPQATDATGTSGEDATGESTGQDRLVVITPEGMGVAHQPQSDDTDSEGTSGKGKRRTPADLVEEPAKVMRIGSMVKHLLDEVKAAPLDEAGRTRLARIHRQSLDELKDGLAPELIEELDRIALPFSDDSPSDAELRIAQAQLVGWLEGLFHGIQTALVAQQMAAQQQLAQMRALPGGVRLQPGMPGGPGAPGGDTPPSGPTGQYL